MATKTNCTINGKEYYRIRRTIGHKTNAKGETVPIIKAFYGTSKRNAEQLYEEWKDKQRAAKEERNHMHNHATFGELANFYDEKVLKKSSRYAPSSIERYDSAYRNWIKPDTTLTNIEICDLTAMDLQMYFNRLGATYATMKQVRKFMAAFFKWLVMQGYCSNLLTAIELPRAAGYNLEPKVITWDDSELETIMEALDVYRQGKYRLRLFIYMGIMTGMRIGELLGLQYQDITGDVLNINRQVYNGLLRPPKYNSARQIPIHPVLQDEIERHKEWHEHESVVHKYDLNHVFTSNWGHLLESSNVRISLNRFYKRIGIEPKKFHAYRSTFCTLLCRNGVPIQTASKLLGHKSVEVTAKYYTDVNMEEKRAALQALPLYHL